ncbi:serine-rich adhesin for platelets isoform X2 [Anopheles funestus]|uniref:serine-rich adhesin for platelets isoform X2 n=1 Tax=Anopheles funestus TaxID=62324 RepID=UPI0020C680CA|nr:serine-rich adhesin for platelets isoform X2 [Anopheles funestus]
MHLHFEKNSNTRCDCPILSLSWMGKVPDDIPEEEGWKLNRTNYYQEGWLATGNVRGIVGVTFTTSHCKKNVDYPLRTNYNLRGHRSDVILVKWNEPYQKLASCDSSGIIFVWIKYEGRWSVELINDRNTPVTHFSWSHDGRMALICYQDGFVLVGSVAGQRYWSSMLNLDATITCGIWTPDDQQVYFGTTQGQIIVMDVHGAMVSQVPLSSDVGITAMAWSCEKFKMEEGEDTEPGVTNASKRSFVLAVSFQNGYIYLLKSYDDITPSQIHTGMNGELGIVMEWSNSRELLAVAGTELGNPHVTDIHGATVYNNLLKFYTESGNLLYTAKIPNSAYPVSALTWGHNDKRIFIATGTQVHIAWVSRRVASLQLFCRLKVQTSLASEALLPRLPLPGRIKALIGNLFAQTIRCCVPDLKSLREFVSRPPACSTRLHCTMIRHDDDSNQSSGTCYTLYLEFLGGLVPLLKGKRTSKIRPEFVIFDPQVDEVSTYCTYSSDSTTTTTTTKSSSTSSHSTTGTNGRSDSSESDIDDECRSPRLDRKRKTGTKKRNPSSNDRSPNQNSDSTENNEDLAYLDTLPEHVKLVEVTSNIWGTKFKIHGLAKTLPANLGQVTYKTSLLHLQPRQMKLVITELRDDFPTGPDPNFNPNIFSEDEEDQQHQQQLQQQHQHHQQHTHQMQHHSQHHSNGTHSQSLGTSSRDSSGSGAISRKLLNESAPPIAPMSPRPNRFPSRPRRQQHQPSALAGCSSATGGLSRNGLPGLGPLARAESYEDDTDGAESSVVVVSDLHSAAARTPPRQSIGYSLVSRPSSASSNQSRVAISPLYCEGSVPTLQSPKNAVAPSDIIFDRPPAGQTTLMSYSSNNDYIGSLVQVKNALVSSDHHHGRSTMNTTMPLNLNLNLDRTEANRSMCTNGSSGKDTQLANARCTPKKQNLKFIDEESTPSTSATAVVSASIQTPTPSNSTTTAAPTTAADSNGLETPMSETGCGMHRTPTVASMMPFIPSSASGTTSTRIPDSITRSCSVGYLDNMTIVPGEEALSMMRRDAPYKRLVLVDKKRQKKYKRNLDELRQATRLRVDAKSKSLDSCSDILQDVPNLNRDLINLFRQMPKVNELSENETEYSSSDQLIVGGKSCLKEINGVVARKGAPMKFGPGVSGQGGSKTPVLNRKEKPKSCSICKQISPTVNSTEPICVKCRKTSIVQDVPVDDGRKESSVGAAGTTTTNDSQVITNGHDTVSAGKPPQAPPKAKRTTLGQYIRSACSNHYGDHSNGKDSNGAVTSSGKGGGFFDRKSSSTHQQQNLQQSQVASSECTAGSSDPPAAPAPSNSTPSRSVARIVTSFTDSPLFSRRNRQAKAMESGADSTKPPSESNTPILLRWNANRHNKQSKADSVDSPKKHRRNGSCPGPSNESSIDGGESSIGMASASSQTEDPRPSGSGHNGPGGLISRWRDMEDGGRQSTPPASPARLARSSPASPTPSKKSKRHQSASPIRHILNSPLLNRRQRKKQHTESSDDENGGGGSHNHSSPSNHTDDSSGSTSAKQYRDLETFQKAQLRQKLKRGKIEPNGVASSSQSPAPVRREFVMHNKAPMWNENSQVYQLDFGGRVTQESAKNFQIEFRGKQVMQFGRIDGNAYTLDFQYPFSALQAFAVALANVTQRLK